MSDRCPLPAQGDVLIEGDIPYECVNCLQLTFDENVNWELGLNDPIGVQHEERGQVVDEGGDPDCQSNAYFWNTSIIRGKVSERIIEIAASCDDCGNFVSHTYVANCAREVD